MPRPKVLVIDDDYAFADFARLLLGALGCEPLVALSGEEGLELARAQAPRLILLDIAMPDLSGLEVIRRLKADPTTRGIPILVCSMSRSPAELRQALDCGAADFIRKPLKRSELKSRIDKVLEAP